MWTSVLEMEIEKGDIGIIESMSNLTSKEFVWRMTKMVKYIDEKRAIVIKEAGCSKDLLSAACRGDMACEVSAALFSFATAALKLKACELTKLTPLVSD